MFAQLCCGEERKKTHIQLDKRGFVSYEIRDIQSWDSQF